MRLFTCLFFLFFFFFSTNAFSQWVEVDIPSGSPVYAIEKVGNDIYALTSQYTIMKSTDGGQNWDFLNMPAEYDAQAFDQQIKILTTIGGAFIFFTQDGIGFRTTDGGMTWTAITPQDEIVYSDWGIVDMHEFGNEMLIEYVNLTYDEITDEYEKEIYFDRSVTLSAYLDPVSLPTANFTYGISPDKLYLSDLVTGDIYYTSDLSTWTTLTAAQPDMLLINGFGSNIVCVNSLGNINYTVDGGQNWLNMNSGYLPSNDPSSSPMFVNPDYGLFGYYSTSGIVVFNLNTASIALYNPAPLVNGYGYDEFMIPYTYFPTPIVSDSLFLCQASNGILAIDEDFEQSTTFKTGLGIFESLVFFDQDSPFAFLVTDSAFYSVDYGNTWLFWPQMHEVMISLGTGYSFYYGLDEINIINNSFYGLIEDSHLYAPEIGGAVNIIANGQEIYYFEEKRVRQLTLNSAEVFDLISQTSDTINFSTNASSIYIIDNYIITSEENPSCTSCNTLHAFNDETGVEIDLNLDPSIENDPFNYIYQKGNLVHYRSSNYHYYSNDGFQTWHPYETMYNGNIIDGDLFQDINVFSNGSASDHIFILHDNELLLSIDGGLHFVNTNNPFPTEASVNYAYQILAHNPMSVFVKGPLGIYKTDNLIEETTTIQIYVDDNQDSIFNESETPLNNAYLSFAGSELLVSSFHDGKTYVPSENLPDTITPHYILPYYTFNPTSIYIQDSSTTIYIAATPLADKNDLGIAASQFNIFQPGFGNTINLRINNLGTTSQAPLVYCKLPSILTAQTMIPQNLYATGDTLFWQLPALAPLEQFEIQINTILDANSIIGTVIYYSAGLVGSPFELTPLNNHTQVVETVFGSYDPNDKQVKPSTLHPDLASQSPYLEYTIRFQNTGNYPASFVRITDTLSELLDLSTVEILDYSHEPMMWQVKPNRVLDFFFNPINLPDSVNNEPASHGFVRFRIKPLPGLALNDAIPNNADIFFDFNAPVRTNTATMSVALTPVADHLEPDLALFPNPTMQYMALLGDFKPVTYQLYDTQGRLIAQGTWTESLDLIYLPAGKYQILFTDIKQQTATKELVKY
jgi:hypothetical protein